MGFQSATSNTNTSGRASHVRMTRDATHQDDGVSEYQGWDADSDNITVGEETLRGHFHKPYRDA